MDEKIIDIQTFCQIIGNHMCDNCEHGPGCTSVDIEFVKNNCKYWLILDDVQKIIKK